jgi:hypothetical protein
MAQKTCLVMVVREGTSPDPLYIRVASVAVAEATAREHQWFQWHTKRMTVEAAEEAVYQSASLDRIETA